MYETHIAKSVNLDDKIKKTYFDTVFVQEDNQAHRISVHMYRGNEQVTMTGATVKGYFFMGSDTLPKEITGSMSGNVASVLLTEACYSKTGQFTLIIKVETTNETCTVLYGEGSVFSIKPCAAASGTTVQRKVGTLTTDSDGYATVDCGFRPDIVLFTDLFENYEGHDYEYQAAAVFPEVKQSGYILAASAYTSNFPYGVEFYTERTTNGFGVEVYKVNDSGDWAPVNNEQFHYVAIKYT